MTKKRFVDFLILLLTTYCLLLTFLLSGCGYTIQTRATLPFETISVGRVENKTSEPKLQDRLHETLAETFAQYGYGVSSFARYRLQGEIYHFELIPTAEVNLAATQYQIVINGSFKLVDTESGKSILLAANSPFITYFNANPTDTLNEIMTQKELAEASALTNLAQTLVSLVTYNTPKNFANLLFKPDDIKNVEDLVIKLRDAKDPLSQYLQDQFSPEGRRRIGAWTSFDYSEKELKALLANELNNIIQNKDIFDEKRFAHIMLSNEALQLIRHNAQGINRVRLNRILLEEAYPDDLAKVQQVPEGKKTST
jgi:hypothetical protein